MFAVRNGILQGRGTTTWTPRGRTTRAEMAAMLVRLLGAKEQGGICPPPGPWTRRPGTTGS